MLLMIYLNKCIFLTCISMCLPFLPFPLYYYDYQIKEIVQRKNKYNIETYFYLLGYLAKLNIKHSLMNEWNQNKKKREVNHYQTSVLPVHNLHKVVFWTHRQGWPVRRTYMGAALHGAASRLRVCSLWPGAGCREVHVVLVVPSPVHLARCRILRTGVWSVFLLSFFLSFLFFYINAGNEGGRFKF